MLRTALFWLACALIVLVLGPLFIFFAYVEPRRRIANALALFWCWTLVKIAGVRLRVENREALFRYPQYVIVSNHQSYMDIFLLILILRKIPHFLAKKELFRIPVFGQALRAADVIEIDRENPIRALKSIRAALSKGLSNPICIYPEGTRSVDGRLQPFRKRGLNLLMDVGLPFVPVAFYGTRNVMPKGSLRVKPARVCVVVGDPVEVDQNLSDEEKARIRELLWQRVYRCLQRAEALCRKDQGAS